MNIGDKVTVHLELDPFRRFVNIYKGWTDTYGNAVNGKKGKIIEIKYGDRFIVEFDKPITFIGNYKREVTLFSMSFKENELYEN